MARTKIKASQVVEDTLEDKDGNTKVSVETSSNEDKIRFTTGGTERMIITDDGKIGIGTSSPTHAFDVNGDIRIRGNDIRDNSGDKVIEMDGSGYLKFTKGVKYARGVLASSSSSPAESGGWIKFASFTSPGTSNLDTAASSFLVCLAGQESTNNRQLDGLFLVHAKHTVNTAGSGTNGSSVTNAYYEPEGTFVVCEPLQASVMSAAGVNDFDPATGLLMIFENDNSTPVVDLYIQCAGKGKRCFVTHLGGTGQTDTPDTDIGFTINTGQSWLTSEPSAPAGSVKITGNYSDKIFNDVALNNIELNGDMLPGTNDSSDLGSSSLRWAEGHFEDLTVYDQLALGGSGSQFFAFNEDTVKVKFANWYSSNTRQYGQGQLWYELWFGAIDDTSGAANRRIGFYLDLPSHGATDAAGGTGQHPTNSRMHIDLDGVHITDALFHEDYLMAELSIPGLDIQADTNAWTFNCPYKMTFEQLDAYLDTVNGDLDITVTNLDDSNNTIFSITNMTASPTSDTTATNANVDAGDRIRFAISNVTGSPQGLRVNVRFRRRP